MFVFLHFDIYIINESYFNLRIRKFFHLHIIEYLSKVLSNLKFRSNSFKSNS